jgi:hypothetical protein
MNHPRAVKRARPDPAAISACNLSSGATLRYTWEEPYGATHWTYRIAGTTYGKPFAVHMTRQGVQELLVLLARSL